MSSATSRSPATVLAANLALHRQARNLDRGQMAERMVALGHAWTELTVAEVESAGRAVSTDELVGVALVLGVSFGDLFDPTLGGNDNATLDLGGSEPLWGPYARLWARGRIKAWLIWSDGDFLFSPGDDTPLGNTEAINAEWRRRPRR
jgi:hypothetical protein